MEHSAAVVLPKNGETNLLIDVTVNLISLKGVN